MKFITPLFPALFIAATSFSASASVSFIPPAGVIDMEAIPSGLSSFEIISSDPVIINRDAPGFATLTLNGKTVREIPASNLRDVYTYSGFSKEAQGDLHITFHPRQQQTSPFRFIGRYTVTIPAGFFTYSGTGLPNDEISIDYVISTPEGSFSPAPGSNLESAEKIALTFKNVTEVTAATLSPDMRKEFFYSFSPADGSESTEVQIASEDISIDGATVTFTLDKVYDTPGSLSIQVPAGAFNVVSTEGIEGHNGAEYAGYSIARAAATEYDFSISPAPGEYESFTSEHFQTPDKYAFFRLDMPEGVNISGYPSMQKPMLLPVGSDGEADMESPFFSFSAQAVQADNALYLYDGNYSNATGGFAYRSESTITPTPGDYILYFPANTFTLSDGVRNSPFSFEYKVIPPANGEIYTITPDPAEEVELPIEHIRISFDETTPDAIWADGSYVTITDGIAEYVLRPDIAHLDYGGSSLDITIPGGGITEPGIYTVTIPATALTIGANPTGISFRLYAGVEIPPLTGVETLTPDDESGATFSVSGMRLPDGMVPAKGIVIRNGKKIVIR